LIVATSILAAAALIATGTIIGVTVAGARPQSRAPGPSAQSLRPPVSQKSSRPQVLTQSRSPRLGPLVLPPPGPGPGGPPGLGGPPASGGKPAIGLPQLTGDSHTEFVVHGQGWVPGQLVTVRLVGVGISPDRVVVDDGGSFSYVINQGHEFFPGGLPLRTYTVIVTAADGTRAVARFAVLRR
jgi:hypothetical protein